MFKEYLTQYRREITEGNINNGICFDGAVNPQKYFGQEKRLLFLLKETNGNDMNGKRNKVTTDWDYMEWVQSQADMDTPLYRSAFRNVAMWSRMFERYTKGIIPKVEDFINEDGLIINKELCKSLENVAIVNLKKSWGVEQTDWKTMKLYLENSICREILLHQANELKPSLVLCGGTFDFAHMVFGENCCIQKEKGVDGQVLEFFEKDKTIFVKCYHPSRPGWSRKDSFEHMRSIFDILL